MRGSVFPALSLSAAVLLLLLFLPAKVMASTTTPATTSLPAGITLVTSERLYIAGDTVRVMAEVHSYSVGGGMLITVYAPDQTAFTSRTLANIPRFVEYTFNLNQGESRLGEWRVVALHGNERTESTFTLVDRNDFHQIILNEPVLRGTMGQELTPENQRAGRPMAVSAAVVSDDDGSSHQFTFVVQVLDSDGFPVHVSFVLGSVAPGQTANPAASWTPVSAGTYTVEVFVWNSLSAPAAMAEKQAGTFEILA